ncbi:hypothetical protein [Methylomonas koyamae]|nr:hypothetical protein [Methylomonas koyamae]
MKIVVSRVLTGSEFETNDNYSHLHSKAFSLVAMKLFFSSRTTMPDQSEELIKLGRTKPKLAGISSRNSTFHAGSVACELGHQKRRRLQLVALEQRLTIKTKHIK